MRDGPLLGTLVLEAKDNNQGSLNGDYAMGKAEAKLSTITGAAGKKTVALTTESGESAGTLTFSYRLDEKKKKVEEELKAKKDAKALQLAKEAMRKEKMWLTLTIEKCNDLVNLEGMMGTSDPYVRAVCMRSGVNAGSDAPVEGGKEPQTSYKDGTLDPVFGDRFTYEVDKLQLKPGDDESRMEIEVFDQDTMSSSSMGVVSIPLSRWAKGTEHSKLELTREGTEGAAGTVTVSVSVVSNEDKEEQWRAKRDRADAEKQRLADLSKERRHLTVTILNCKNLKNHDGITSISDPFVRFSVIDSDGSTAKEHTKETKYIDGELNPEFNEHHSFVLNGAQFEAGSYQGKLSLMVYDANTVSSHELMGTCTLDLPEVRSLGPGEHTKPLRKTGSDGDWGTISFMIKVENEEDFNTNLNVASSVEETKKAAENKAADAMKSMMDGFKKEVVWLRFKVNKCDSTEGSSSVPLNVRLKQPDGSKEAAWYKKPIKAGQAEVTPLSFGEHVHFKTNMAMYHSGREEATIEVQMVGEGATEEPWLSRWLIPMSHIGVQTGTTEGESGKKSVKSASQEEGQTLEYESVWMGGKQWEEYQATQEEANAKEKARKEEQRKKKVYLQLVVNSVKWPAKQSSPTVDVALELPDQQEDKAMTIADGKKAAKASEDGHMELICGESVDVVINEAMMTRGKDEARIQFSTYPKEASKKSVVSLAYRELHGSKGTMDLEIKEGDVLLAVVNISHKVQDETQYQEEQSRKAAEAKKKEEETKALKAKPVKLILKIERCEGLANIEEEGHGISDPYVKCMIKHATGPETARTTETKHECLDPHFNAKFEFSLNEAHFVHGTEEALIEMEVMDENLKEYGGTDGPMGKAYVKLSSVSEWGKPQRVALQLPQPEKGKDDPPAKLGHIIYSLTRATPADEEAQREKEKVSKQSQDEQAKKDTAAKVQAKVVVEECSQIFNWYSATRINPTVKVVLERANDSGHEEQSTKIVKDSFSPQYNESFVFDLNRAECKAGGQLEAYFSFQVHDKQLGLISKSPPLSISSLGGAQTVALKADGNVERGSVSFMVDIAGLESPEEAAAGTKKQAEDAAIEAKQRQVEEEAKQAQDALMRKTQGRYELRRRNLVNAFNKMSIMVDNDHLGAVDGALKLSIEFDPAKHAPGAPEREAFEALLRKDLATSLKTDQARFEVMALRAGSVRASFRILTDSKEGASAAELRKELMRQASGESKKEALFQGELTKVIDGAATAKMLDACIQDHSRVVVTADVAKELKKLCHLKPDQKLLEIGESYSREAFVEVLQSLLPANDKEFESAAVELNTISSRAKEALQKRAEHAAATIATKEAREEAHGEMVKIKLKAAASLGKVERKSTELLTENTRLKKALEAAERERDQAKNELSVIQPTLATLKGRVTQSVVEMTVLKKKREKQERLVSEAAEQKKLNEALQRKLDALSKAKEQQDQDMKELKEQLDTRPAAAVATAAAAVGGSMEGRMSEVEGSLAGLTRVLLQGIGDLPASAAPPSAVEKAPVVPYEPRFEDVNAEVDFTMSNYRSRMGLPRGWTGEEEEEDEVAPYHKPMPGTVTDFTLDTNTVTGLRKLRQMRQSEEATSPPPFLCQPGAVRRTLGKYDQNRDQVLDEGELNQLLGDMATGEFDPTQLVRVDSTGSGIGVTSDGGALRAMATLQSLHDRYETLDRM